MLKTLCYLCPTCAISTTCSQVSNAYHPEVIAVDDLTWPVLQQVRVEGVDEVVDVGKVAHRLPAKSHLSRMH